MKAAVLRRHGGMEALELRDDWPLPEPGPGQVLVRVAAAAVNNTDVWTREGAYGLPGRPEAKAGWRGPLEFPLVQGGDIAGNVSEVGAGVPTEWVGRRVLVDAAFYADDGEDAPPVGLLGSERDGGFAEYVVVDADRLHDMGASPLSDQELAALPVAYGTAMGMLERAEIRRGETVLVTGASGGVGLALVQLAAARGARVVALTSESKAAALEEAGASTTLPREADPADLERRLDAAAPGGLDAVADVAGGPWLARLLPALRENGRWVIAGAVAGPVVTFDLRRLYLHNLRLIGSSMHTRAHFAALAELARTGNVRPRIAAGFPLADIHAAQKTFRDGRHVGKITIIP
ncbi:zinc-binding dehydrogenase [Streptomyces sp. 3MP-14]|uniref:Zinc-binding dehydrogenase n=1 Tax=Streptomyces mimosae TaxID=2586635 RepID=A0A5N5ZYY9_9ACTN|nr:MULTISPECIES: zinc-binding dehydrogenase [Streptomyces]KAB8161485.1 zinc-binding dehydrogenase [Streptomyces mimosae]KAB8173316.1 zinc-binding dehydrogenase [Streptomyces sp. 3MP-14]